MSRLLTLLFALALVSTSVLSAGCPATDDDDDEHNHDEHDDDDSAM